MGMEYISFKPPLAPIRYKAARVRRNGAAGPANDLEAHRVLTQRHSLGVEGGMDRQLIASGLAVVHTLSAITAAGSDEVPGLDSASIARSALRTMGRTPDLRPASPGLTAVPSPDTASVIAAQNTVCGGRKDGRHERPHCSLALSICS